ncbi:serine hydrolase [Mycolicibacter longobardus]|nr:serine hydrolase [Mycolicibacter longobardus]MCV7384089.1 serine hydrolase [Mycolicibacter longobardus]
MRPSMLLLTIVMVISTVVFGCDEKVYGAAATRPPQYRAPEVTPVATAIEAPLAPAIQPVAVVDGLATRMQEATEQAAKAGANISVAVLDRISHQLITNGNTRPIATASVAKLFIADDLLMHQPEAGLSADDRAALDVMLRSSDDGAAETFWNQNGRNAIVNRVASRYGLAGTSPPSNGAWWNTISTAPDLARYYDMLLNGSGGLPADRASIMMGDLAQSTPTGIDGYPQRFGIPEGLYDEPVAVKQGWMCCIGSNWMHLSTGVVGADRRYIVVIESLQPSDDATARTTITEAVKTIFPGGRV